MDDLTDRFLKAFDEIHSQVRKLVPDDRSFDNFVAGLSEAARKNANARSHRHELLSFADLRNLIAHRHHAQIAMPSLMAVQRIEKIRDNFTNPPKLVTHFSMEVAHCSPNAKIGVVAEMMRAGDFSQMPVYEDGKFVTLITTETISRWFAHTIAVNGGMLEDAKVADALGFTVPETKCEFVKRDASVFDALDLFDSHYGKGHTLEAIIISNNAQKTDKPLGIITIYDVPQLRSLE